MCFSSLIPERWYEITADGSKVLGLACYALLHTCSLALLWVSWFGFVLPSYRSVVFHQCSLSSNEISVKPFINSAKSLLATKYYSILLVHMHPNCLFPSSTPMLFLCSNTFNMTFHKRKTNHLTKKPNTGNSKLFHFLSFLKDRYSEKIVTKLILFVN